MNERGKEMIKEETLENRESEREEGKKEKILD